MMCNKGVIFRKLGGKKGGGGTFFFTLVTYERRQVFGEEQAVE
jgi:hypothetical protein